MKRRLFVLIAVLFATNAVTVQASTEDSRWAVRGYGGYLPTVSDSDTEQYTYDGLSSGSIDASADWNGELGSTSAFGLGVEYRVTRHRLGLELSGMFANIQGDLTGTATVGSITDIPLSETVLVDYTPVYLGPNVHLLKKDWPVDLYVGAYGVWTRLANGTFTVLDMPIDFNTENSFGWGLNAGLDAKLGQSPWIVSAGVRALTSDSTFSIGLDSSGEDALVGPLEFDIYPLTFLAGVGYRF